MVRSNKLTLWLSLWLAVLSLNSVLAMVHAGHGHNICSHGEITHEEEDPGETAVPQRTSWASVHAAHQHCATSPWSRTAARLSFSPIEMLRDVFITQYVHVSITTTAFSNIALTHQAPKNSPPLI